MSNKVGYYKPYTIGLDIGTSSIGYAVITDDYKVISKRMKVLGNTEKTTVKRNLLGSVLFNEGDTAGERRQKRNTRRRLARRHNRIAYLQQFLADDIEKVDTAFFHRLNESFLVEDDKTYSKHYIFGNLEEEVQYRKDYKTIYHLRKDMAEKNQKFDIRLVYLAIAHILKNRGHFLIEGELDTNSTDVNVLFKEFLQSVDDIYQTDYANIDEDFKMILLKSASNKDKKKRLASLFPKTEHSKFFDEMLNMIVGNSGKFNKADEKIALKFNDDAYLDNLDELIGSIGEEYLQLFEQAKTIYDATVLSKLLKEGVQSKNAPLSTAMVKKYENHETDLALFKTFMKQYLPESYHEMFKDVSCNGYAKYVANGEKLSREEFYTYVKSKVDGIAEAKWILDKIEINDFLLKQRTTDNGSIPHQIHLKELEAILNNQGQYYDCILKNKDKIMQLLTFRIPYHVGPLAKGQSEFAWIKRKDATQPIRPWNFEKVVDVAESAEEFIVRMTNSDTYLPTEKVLPKHSLLYEMFLVYNELTKIKIVTEREEKIFLDTEQKELIFNNLFKVYRKVGKKQLLEYIDCIAPEYRIKGVEGLEKDGATFNASFGTYHDLLKIIDDKSFLDNDNNIDVIEDIIHTLTVFEDKKIILEKLEKYSHLFNDATLKKLSKRHYTGWGRLSKKMIVGIRNKTDQKNILDYLKGDVHNRNFMQLINDTTLSFKDDIENAQMITGEDNIDTIVNELAGSPKIKKGIRQSLKIVDELVRIMGYKPQRIVIEMARENQTTQQGKKASTERVKKIEKVMAELGSDLWKQEQAKYRDKLHQEKVYLYFMQNGKDMYDSSKDLDISNLKNYQVDHIIPQNFIKDDSFDNKVLTKLDNNQPKGDNVPSLEIIRKNKPYWEHLAKVGAISPKKLSALTMMERGGLTDSIKAMFIQRQLVETRQITKHVARILHTRFNNSEDITTQIVTLKSAMVSQFRQQFELYKMREVNYYHHAHDAYLNAVVGTALIGRYPNLMPNFVYGKFKKIANTFTENKATARKMFFTNILKFFERDNRYIDENGIIIWDKAKHINLIEKVIYRSQVNVVKLPEIQKGRLYKETIQKHSPSKNLIAVKNYLHDTSKYGGVIKDTTFTAYTIVVVASAKLVGAKRKKLKFGKDVLGITNIERKQFEENPIAFLENKGYVDVTKVVKLPKYTLLEFESGTKRMIASDAELQKANEMRLPKELMDLVYHANVVNNTNNEEKKLDSLEYITEHEKDFDKLFETIYAHFEKYGNKAAVLSQIKTLYNKREYSVDEKAESFISLLTLSRTGASAEFKFFGEKIERARYTGGQTQWLEAIVSYYSVTGLYETRLDLRKL